MNNPIASRFNESNPCPVCGSGTKGCSDTEDKLHFCRGEAGLDWKLIKADVEGFSLYRHKTDTTNLRNGRLSPKITMGRKKADTSKAAAAAPPKRDWAGLAKQYADALSKERREQLADELGLPLNALDAVPLIGWCPPAKWWSFPEVGKDGTICGIMRRWEGGVKKRANGAKCGVTVPAGWMEHSGPLLLVEGASDVLAASHCGISVLGRPSNKAGVEILVELLKDWPADRPIIVTGENDLKESGEFPGKEGAEQTAAGIAKGLGRSVMWAMPPDGIKDVRAWVTRVASPDYPTIGQEIIAHLTANATPVPGEDAEHDVEHEGEDDPGAPKDGGESTFSDPAELDRLAKLKLDDAAAFAAYRASFRKKRGGSVRDLDKALEPLVTVLRQERQEERRRERDAAGDTFEPTPPPYFARGNVVYHTRATKDGEIEVPLGNFAATITSVVIRDDGAERRQFFTVEGRTAGGLSLPATDVLASEFEAMDWVSGAWGNSAIVYAGSGTKDHFRCATQVLSGVPPERTVYSHTGWRQVGGRWCYLHAAGSIGAEEGTDVCVDLSGPLGKFVLPTPPAGRELVSAVNSLLAMFDEKAPLAPDRILVPIFGTSFRAVLGGSLDFGLFINGPTGVCKSEIGALNQQCYGAGLDSRNLPGNWSSTANSLEQIAFTAKDAAVTFDDFAPNAAVDPQKLHAAADRVFRGAGNGAGRGRLNADLTIRPDRPPRGLVVATGEDPPKGHSLRSRLPIVDVKPGDVCLKVLTRCQRDAAGGLYASALAGYIGWLAPCYDEIRTRLPAERAESRDTFTAKCPHARTPGAVGDLMLGWRYFVAFAQECGAIMAAHAEALLARVRKALVELADAQSEHLSHADPVDQFIGLFANLLSSKQAHIESLNGGRPDNHESYGWVLKAGDWQGAGVRMGWEDKNHIYLLPDACFGEVQQLANKQRFPISMGMRTLWARLRERKILLTGDIYKGKVRHTSRISVRGVRHEVLKFPRNTLFPEAE